MGKDDDMMIMLVLGVAVIGGILIFAPNILGRGGGGGLAFGDQNLTGEIDLDSEIELGCGVSETRFLNYYADRVAEELDKWTKKGIKRDMKLELKGRVLLSYKNNLRKLYEINQGCIVPLEGEAKAIFVDVLLKAANRLDVKVPIERKQAWKELINQELNAARTARLIRSRHVTKISVL